MNIVTGAFGFSGKYITRLLIERGEDVVTFTSKTGKPNPYGDRLKVAPLDFGNRDALTETMRGADALFNSYWIRFPMGAMTFDKAIENSKTLIHAARDAGVKRIVHIGIANPSLESKLPYYRGKAMVEEEIRRSGLGYAILRPTVIFGDEGILINNIAWIIRAFPVLPVLGDGEYKLQPIYVEDLARLAVDAALSNENIVKDACGPEIYTYNELARMLAGKIGAKLSMLHLPPALAYVGSKFVGLMKGDVVLTWDEVIGLMDNLLVSSEPPVGTKKLSEWVEENADKVGKGYFSELKQHYRAG